MHKGNWKLKILNSRGEIATVLTVVTLGLMLVGTFVGTKLAEKSTEQRAKAQSLNGCQIVDTDLGPGCWCSQGGWQEHCFAGAKRGDKPSQLCIDNCAAKNGTQPSQNITPAPPGTGSQTASCTLAAQEPNVGNCCGTCISSKRPDLRPFFNNNGWSACNDTQIVNNWCNGVSDEATRDCNALKTGDCLAECSKDQNTCTATGGATSGTAGSPAPTSPPAGGPGGGPGGNEGPAPIITPRPGGYLLVKPGGFINLSTQITPVPLYVNVEPAYSQSFINPDSTYGKLPFPTGYEEIVSGDNRSYKYHLPSERSSGNSNPLVQRLDYSSSSPIDVKIHVDDDRGLIQEYTDNDYVVCFPNITPPSGQSLTVPTIAAKCNRTGAINQIELDLTGEAAPPTTTPIPTPAIAYYVFTIRLVDSSGDTAISSYTLTFDTQTNLSNFKTNSGGIVTIGFETNQLSKNSNSPDQVNLAQDTTTALGLYTNEYISDSITPFVYQANVPSNILTPMMPVINSIKITGQDANVSQATFYYSEITPCPIVQPNPDYDTIKANCPAKEQRLILNSTTPIPIGPIGASGATGPTSPSTPTEQSVAVSFQNLNPPAASSLDDDYYYILNVEKIIVTGEVIQCNPSSFGQHDTLTTDPTWVWSDTNVKTCNFNKTINTRETIQFMSGVLNIYKWVWAGGEVATSCNIPNVNSTPPEGEMLKVINFKISTTTTASTSNPSKNKISGCTVTFDPITDLLYGRSSLFGSSNEAFRKAMERWINGEIGVLEMSGFINQLTRTPGLQIVTCDPRKGECNPTF